MSLTVQVLSIIGWIATAAGLPVLLYLAARSRRG
jgi:hypothetical protein